MKTKASVDEPKNELPDDDVPNDDVANDVALKIKAYVEPRHKRLANRNLVLKNVDTVVLEQRPREITQLTANNQSSSFQPEAKASGDSPPNLSS